MWTTDELLVDPAVPADLRARGVVSVDMETAAVAEVCDERGVSWSVVRAISDRASDGSVDAEIVGLSHPNGRANFSAVASYLVRHLHRGVQVVAHQVQLMLRRVRRVHRHFRGRQLEDQPPTAGIDIPVAQCVPKEGTVGLCVAAVNNDMSTRDHVGDATPEEQVEAFRIRPLDTGAYTTEPAAVQPV